MYFITADIEGCLNQSSLLLQFGSWFFTELTKTCAAVALIVSFSWQQSCTRHDVRWCWWKNIFGTWWGHNAWWLEVTSQYV